MVLLAFVEPTLAGPGRGRQQTDSKLAMVAAAAAVVAATVVFEAVVALAPAAIVVAIEFWVVAAEVVLAARQLDLVAIEDFAAKFAGSVAVVELSCLDLMRLGCFAPCAGS